MTQLTENVFAVEAPEYSKNYRLGKSERLKGKLFYNTTLDYFAAGQVIDLPPGSWQLLCTTSEAQEEQLKEIVRELPVGKRWHNYNGDYPVWWHSAKESLNSLLTSKGLDVNKNYCLLKKK